MLKQELCKKCMKQATTTGWSMFDDGNWSYRFVVCPGLAGSENSLRHTYLPPPKWCPFAVEHVALGQTLQKGV